MNFLTEKIWFPNPVDATSDGLLAIGGDLSAERLMLAYNSGIFPWFEDKQPILWWSPNPRMVLFPDKFRLSKSLKKTIRTQKFRITINQNFEEVILFCAKVPRNGETGTWITKEMRQAYIELHKLGHAVSFEVWQNNTLVGGLYGIDLPERKIFCGESMFSLVSDASKVAFYYLSEYVGGKNYKLIDCQIYNSHLESLGAEEIGRIQFLKILKE